MFWHKLRQAALCSEEVQVFSDKNLVVQALSLLGGQTLPHTVLLEPYFPFCFPIHQAQQRDNHFWKSIFITSQDVLQASPTVQQIHPLGTNKATEFCILPSELSTKHRYPHPALEGSCWIKFFLEPSFMRKLIFRKDLANRRRAPSPQISSGYNPVGATKVGCCSGKAFQTCSKEKLHGAELLRVWWLCVELRCPQGGQHWGGDMGCGWFGPSHHQGLLEPSPAQQSGLLWPDNLCLVMPQVCNLPK